MRLAIALLLVAFLVAPAGAEETTPVLLCEVPHGATVIAMGRNKIPSMPLNVIMGTYTIKIIKTPKKIGRTTCCAD